MPRSELAVLLNDFPAFRQKQVAHWLYQKGVLDPALMHNLPGDLQARLGELDGLLTVELLSERPSDDAQTTKYLVRCREDGKITEMVVMRHAKGRKTLCVSSQIGCPVGCTFCATGQMGFARQLTAEEIFDQVVLARHLLMQEPGVDTQHVPTNLVFMGMGEPFLNYDAVLEVVHRLQDTMQIGGRRLTISTSGVAPAIKNFADEGLQVNLALSLHAVRDELRTEIMPINQRFPLAELRDALAYYIEQTHRKVFIEYIMIKDKTDSTADARLLADWLPSRLLHVNLIPYNPIPGSDYVTSEIGQIQRFQTILKKAGYHVTIRYNMGGDVNAACGQLASEEAKKHVKKKPTFGHSKRRSAG